MFRYFPVLVLGILFVVACNSGGGGGGAAPATTPTTPNNMPTTPSTPRGWTSTQEYTRQPGLVAIKASGAYRRGWTGDGVTIGVLDGGVVWRHAEFDGRIDGYPALVEFVTPPMGGEPALRWWKLSTAQARDAYRFHVTRDNPATQGVDEYFVSISVGTFRGTPPTQMTDSEIENDKYSEIGVFRDCSTTSNVFSCADLGTTSGTLRHGVSVSGTAVADRNNVGSFGVAYDAKVLVGLSGAGTGGVRSDLEGYGSARIEVFRREQIAYMNRHVKIVFHSYGISTGTVLQPAQVLTQYTDLATVLQQESTARAQRAIHVYAAGNGCPSGSPPSCNTARPQFPALLPFYFTQLANHQIVAVVAIDADNNLVSGYHQCGVAQNWCVAAPGYNVLAPGLENSVSLRARGTSYAAPHVAGVLALMREAFPTLGTHELVQRLFTTANKSAPCNVAATHGQGCVDADAATRPVGSTTVVRADGFGSFLAQNTHFVSPVAFGDSFAQVANKKIAAFDELNAPFMMPLAVLFESAPVERLRNFMGAHTTYKTLGNERFFSMEGGLNGGAFSGLDDFWGRSMPYIHLAGEESFGSGVGFAFLGQEMRVGVFAGTPSYLVDDIHNHNPAQGLVLSYGSPKILEMHFGVLHEQDRLFGGVGSGGFGEELRTQHIFGGFSKTFAFGKTHIFVGGQLGVTWVLESDRYLLHFPSEIVGSSFLAGMGRDDVLIMGDKVALKISQPLRVERGNAVLSFASGRRLDGTRVGRAFNVDLRPSGRELALELFYNLPVSPRATVRTSLGYYMEPGHRKNAQSELGVMAAFSLKF